MKIDFEKFMKYEMNKRDLFMKHFTEKLNELNNGVFEDFRKKITPYENVLDGFNKASEQEKEELMKTKEVQEAFAIISDAEKLKDNLIIPEETFEFFRDNLTISETELKQYLYD